MKERKEKRVKKKCKCVKDEVENNERKKGKKKGKPRVGKRAEREGGTTKGGRGRGE